MISEKNLEQTIEKYSNTLYRLCILIVKNEQDVQDVLQETFLKYYKSAPEFQSEEHKKAWLIRVSQNKCKDFLRFHKRHQHVPLEAVEEILEIYQEASADEQMDFEILWDLDPKYKSVLVLHYLEGYSMEEVAKLLGISLAAARKRLQRGRTFLAEKNNNRKKGVVAYE